MEVDEKVNSILDKWENEDPISKLYKAYGLFYHEAGKLSTSLKESSVSFLLHDGKFNTLLKKLNNMLVLAKLRNKV